MPFKFENPFRVRPEQGKNAETSEAVLEKFRHQASELWEKIKTQKTLLEKAAIDSFHSEQEDVKGKISSTVTDMLKTLTPEQQGSIRRSEIPYEEWSQWLPEEKRANYRELSKKRRLLKESGGYSTTYNDAVKKIKDDAESEYRELCEKLPDSLRNERIQELEREGILKALLRQVRPR